MTRTFLLFSGVAATLLLWRGLVTFPAHALIAWAVVSAMIGLGVWQRIDEHRGRTRTPPSRAGVLCTLAAFLGGVLGAEVVQWTGFVAGPVIVAVLAAAGWWCGRRALTRGTRGRPAVSVQATVPGAATEELCLVWRRSGERARGVPDDDPERGQLAAVRQLLLDEMERRDPAGFRRWLAGGAMAGTDPLPFLRGNQGVVRPGSGAGG